MGQPGLVGLIGQDAEVRVIIDRNIVTSMFSFFKSVPSECLLFASLTPIVDKFHVMVAPSQCDV